MTASSAGMPIMRAWPFLALALALWAGAVARDRLDAWVAATELPALMVETGVEVVARDGRLLRAFTVADGRWRLAVTPAEVDRDYLAMLVAYEDRRFWRHLGVDPLALLRAGWQALLAGRPVSGGSTLTMQVARLLEDSGTGRWAGKLRQIRVALALERRLPKEAILGLYLNLAPMGGNLEGVRAAAFAWFGKEPRRLTPAEAALLVALPQAPEARRPDRAPEAARAARARVLGRMVRAGRLEAAAAAAAETEPVPTVRRPFPALAPHVAERLRAGAPLARRHATTIDAGLQARLERLAADAVAGEAERLSVAVLVADHASGEILASVGSAGWLDGAREGFIDMTQALRSPGSTLKPLVYGLAFDRGLAHPETLIEDRPVAFGTYAPQNFDRSFHGTIRLREALQLSLNIPVVLLTEALGPEALIAALGRAGIAAEIPGGKPGLAVALGGVGISLQGLVTLYGGIARGGSVLPLRLAATGAAAAAAAPGPRRLLSPEAAWQLADILAAMPPPPGAPASRLAYKTGTSYGHRDALALGFDGRHVAGVWLGRADGSPIPGAFGAGLAAPVLFEVFARLKPALEPLPPPPPATLIAANPALPPPLRRFRGRDGALSADPEAPAVAFPPDGAEVETAGGPLLVRVREGVAPFTWLADGRPFAVATREREAWLLDAGPGFVTLSVIDAEGRSARVRVVLR